MTRQCELAGIARSGLYYSTQPEDELNLALMRRIDALYTDYPFFGSRRMTAWLKREGYRVNRKRVSRLMQLMGLEAIYPKPTPAARIPSTASIPTYCGR